MNLSARAEGLLQLVEGWREQQCRQLHAEAAARAGALLQDAWRQARADLHHHVVNQRARAESLIQAARAERLTRERRRGERADAILVEAAWPRLVEALAERWADPGARADWVAGALQQALARLPRVAWSVRHAPDWPVAEATALREAVTRAIGTRPELRADGAIQAGLIIASGGAVLDATSDGLLRDRAAVEARLLALWQAERPGGSAHGVRQ